MSKLSMEEVPGDSERVPRSELGTDNDAHDMTRMGKKQVLRVSQVSA